MIILPDSTSVIKSFEMTLHSKHRTEQFKNKNQIYRNIKTPYNMNNNSTNNTFMSENIRFRNMSMHIFVIMINLK